MATYQEQWNYGVAQGGSDVHNTQIPIKVVGELDEVDLFVNNLTGYGNLTWTLSINAGFLQVALIEGGDGPCTGTCVAVLDKEHEG